MKYKSIKFRDIPVGASFRFNGNNCIKKSTRTAWVEAWFPGQKAMWFYWGMDDMCTVDIEGDK